MESEPRRAPYRCLGEALLAPTVTKRLIATFASRVEPPLVGAILAALTDHKREVFREVARGLSNLEIAEKLHMSPATAKTHVSRLLMKCGAGDHAQLVVVAYETGLAHTSGRGDDSPNAMDNRGRKG